MGNQDARSNRPAKQMENNRFAPQKMNVKIFERFRKACDEFFKKKGEFFKSLKEV